MIQIPGYELGGEIGRGGMGRVFVARDLKFDREVAIKTLLPGAGTEQSYARFVREAWITGRLVHPGVPPVYNFGELDGGSRFMIMKLVRGRTLAAALAAHPPGQRDTRYLFLLLERVCEIVGYAHRQGVVHRDLKPSNVMVGEFDEVQVMDWGLAKVVGGGPPLEPGGRVVGPHPAVDATTFGSVMGTPGYMPPEQAVGDADNVGPRSDVFAAGAMMCTVLTGHPAFRGPAEEMIRQTAWGDLHDAWQRLRLVPDEHRPWVQLAARCLSADPNDRPKDAATVATELAAIRTQEVELGREAELSSAAARARKEDVSGWWRRVLIILVCFLVIASVVTACLLHPVSEVSVFGMCALFVLPALFGAGFMAADLLGLLSRPRYRPYRGSLTGQAVPAVPAWAPSPSAPTAGGGFEELTHAPTGVVVARPPRPRTNRTRTAVWTVLLALLAGSCAIPVLNFGGVRLGFINREKRLRVEYPTPTGNRVVLYSGRVDRDEAEALGRFLVRDELLLGLDTWTFELDRVEGRLVVSLFVTDGRLGEDDRVALRWFRGRMVEAAFGGQEVALQLRREGYFNGRTAQSQLVETID